MDLNEQPWSEHERVNLLAEVLLKAGSSPSRVLFAAIRDSGIQVRWNDLVLPNGRSLGSCHRAFEELAAQAQPNDYRHPGPPPAPISYSAGRDIPQKRPHPESYTPIQPRPSQPSYMGIPPQAAYGATIPSLGEPASKKKRGRPPKAVTEMRRQEAQAKGEPYPPPRKSRPSISARESAQASPVGPLSYARTPPSASLPAPPTAASTPQGTQPPEPPTESSSGKKKQKPAPLELASPPDLFRPASETQSAVFSNFTPNSAPFSSSPKKSGEPHIPHLQYGSQGPSPRHSLGSDPRDVRMEGVEETQPRTTTPHSFKDTVGI